MLRKIVSGIAAINALVVPLLSFDGWQTRWTEKLDYEKKELYPIELQVNSIPLVEVKINSAPLWVIFDTGCSTGFSLTSAVEGKIEHNITGKSTERNPDGSYRGETTLATISSLEIFGIERTSVETSFTDWRIFSALRFNGLLGLRYLDGKRMTIDYKRKIIGVTERPFIYAAAAGFTGAVVPLLEASGSQADLIYVVGQVKGQTTVIYFDTGSSASFIDPSMLTAGEIKKKKRHFIAENVGMTIGDFSFRVERLRVQEQRRGVNFEYPQTVKLGSDVLKNFLISIDKISDCLFLAKN